MRVEELDRRAIETAIALYLKEVRGVPMSKVRTVSLYHDAGRYSAEVAVDCGSQVHHFVDQGAGI